MISIIHLLEKQAQYEPWMTGIAKQIGGKGYPTAELRVPKPPLGQMQAKQKEAERLQAAETAEAKVQRSRKKNLGPADQLQ